MRLRPAPNRPRHWALLLRVTSISPSSHWFRVTSTCCAVSNSAVTRSCYALREHIIEKAIQGFPHGEQITAALGSKPSAVYKRIDLGLTQLDRYA